MISVQQLLNSKPTQNLHSVTTSNMVVDALEIMAANNIGAVVVMEGERLAGIFSERDYVRKGIIKGRKSKSTPITEVMTANVFTVSPDQDINDCMQLFSSKKIRHLPVKQGEKVVGMLSIGDIVNAIIREQSVHIQYLEEFITRH
jgi:CBS domain-containing protein